MSHNSANYTQSVSGLPTVTIDPELSLSFSLPVSALAQWP
ncbi:hypothetical protein ABIE32_004264 [Comamonas sp. 4034]